MSDFHGNENNDLNSQMRNPVPSNELDKIRDMQSGIETIKDQTQKEVTERINVNDTSVDNKNLKWSTKSTTDCEPG